MSDTTAPTVVDGRYRLLAQLAVGGTSTVHLAEDTTLNRTVALKVLHPHLAADPTFLDRFRREALAVASVSHPNVVTLFDVADDGRYLVMEHVDGPSLRDLLRLEGRLSPERARDVLEPVAEGLQAAHAAGLVHRDVKPENVMIGPGGRVKIGDFGLARTAASASDTFGPDMFAGSPAYTAPEAVRGEPLDSRSDVYALGIVLYECLTGRAPIRADTPFATAMKHTTDRVPSPSALIDDLPAAVDDLVQRATDPDPDGRFRDAGSFGSALRRAVPGAVATSIDVHAPSDHTVVLPVEQTDTVVSPTVGAAPSANGAGPTVPDDPQTDRPPRRRWRWVIAAVALLALLGGGGYVTWDQVVAPMTDVPAVVGQSLQDASTAIEDAGFTVRTADQRTFSLEVPAGDVAGVDPDDRARRGSTITLVLSAGPRQVEVPALDGSPQDDAVATLRDLGLQPEVSTAHDESVPEGAVVSTSPAAGEVVDEATTVSVVVSLGRQPLTVPPLVGVAVDEARGQLESLGLQADVTGSDFHEEIPEGGVLTQSVEAGATLFRGDVVELTVSDGPRPFPMPSVEGATAEDAQAQLEDLGLVVQIQEIEALFGFGAGRVGDQRPDAGTEVRRGDTVQLVVLR